MIRFNQSILLLIFPQKRAVQSRTVLFYASQIVAECDDLRPFNGSDRARLLDTQLLLKGDHRRLCLGAEYPVDRDGGYLGRILADFVEVALDYPHALAAVSLNKEFARIRLADSALIIRRQLAYDHPVNLLNPVKNIRVYHAGHGQAVVVLKGKNRVARKLTEESRYRYRRELGVKVADKREVILKRLDIKPLAAHTELARVPPRDLGDRKPLARQLGQPLDRGVDLLDFVPSSLADYPVGVEVKNLLKLFDGALGLAVINAVDVLYFGDRRVVLRYPVELALYRHNIVAERAYPQRCPRVRLRIAADRRVVDDRNIIAVIVADDLYRRHPAVGKGNAAPLRQPVAACCVAVTKLCVQRLNIPAAHKVVVKDLVHYRADVVVNNAVFVIRLVDGCVVRYVKIIAPAAVVFGIHAVERE